MVLEQDKLLALHKSVCSNQMLSVYQEQRAYRLPRYLYTMFPNYLIYIVRGEGGGGDM